MAKLIYGHNNFFKTNRDNIHKYLVELFIDNYDYNNKFLNKRASDLAGAPFSQTLYTSNKIKRIVLVFAFDFMNDFNIQLKRNEQKKELVFYITNGSETILLKNKYPEKSNCI